jgi:hypothetical protein
MKDVGKEQRDEGSAELEVAKDYERLWKKTSI